MSFSPFPSSPKYSQVWSVIVISHCSRTLRPFVLEKVKVLIAQSCLILVTPWTVAHQVPLSMGFSRQEYWSVLPFPSPGDLPDPGIEPGSPALQADFYHLSHHGRWCPREASSNYFVFNELLQDPDSSGMQGLFGPRMCRMGDVDRIFQTPEMTLEAVISHAFKKGEPDLRSQSSHTG